MDLTQIPLFKALRARLGFLDERQRVLAENIANVDTPGYRPKDVKAPDFERLAHAELQQLTRVATTTTNPHHIAIKGGRSQGDFPVEKGRDVYEVNMSGNAVNLDQELLKVSQTSLDHQTIVDLYRKQVQLIKAALDKGGS